MTRHIIKFITLFFISGSAPASEKSASDATRDFYDLINQGNYSAAARYFDPASLQEFRSLMSPDKGVAEEKKQFFFQEFFEPDLTDESIEKLSDTDFLAAFLHGVITSERFSQMINYKNVEIIGEVKERADLAHVLTRQWVSLGGHKMEVIEVTSFNKVGNEWKMRMTGKLKGVAIMIRQEFLQQ